MGFWSGVKSGFVGAAKGTWDGVKGAGHYAYDFATDGATREAAWDSAVGAGRSASAYAADSWHDPAKPFRDLGNTAKGAYAATETFVRTADAEQWGELVGGGTFTAATLPVGGLAGKAVARGGAALKATRAGSATSKASRAGKFADDKPGACTACKVSRAEPKRQPFHRKDLDDEWYDPETGELRWPPNHGFDGPPVNETLPVGTKLDRYSKDTGLADTNGYFLSPQGASYESRALPYEPTMQKYAQYEVSKPLPVQSGKAAPWFGHPGGSTQHMTGLPVSELVEKGYLKGPL